MQPTPRRTPRGYLELDHTADLRLRVWAKTEEELLEQAAQALIDVLTEQAPRQASGVRRLSLGAPDREERLVRWLNEVLFLASAEGFLLTSAELRLSPGGLEARLSGQEHGDQLVRTELKAVTYHSLSVRQDAEGFEAELVVDR